MTAWQQAFVFCNVHYKKLRGKLDGHGLISALSNVSPQPEPMRMKRFKMHLIDFDRHTKMQPG